MLKGQIYRIIEVYVDDLLVNSKEFAYHLEDLREAFNVLRKYKMKLNLAKYAFSISFGKFLRFAVSECGIEANQ